MQGKARYARPERETSPHIILPVWCMGSISKLACKFHDPYWRIQICLRSDDAEVLLQADRAGQYLQCSQGKVHDKRSTVYVSAY